MHNRLFLLKCVHSSFCIQVYNLYSTYSYVLEFLIAAAHTDIYNKIISLVDKKLKELQMALGGQLPGSLAQSHLRIMAAELAHESAMQFGERFDEDFLANLTREMYKGAFGSLLYYKYIRS